MIPTPSIIELKAIAECWHSLGIPVIPFWINPIANENGVHDKKPKIDTYRKWQTELQTDEEFANLDWTGCNGFGLILGIKTKGGRYLGAIDYDTKNNHKTTEEREAYDNAVKIGAELLRDFPQATKIELTINAGRHLLYWSNTQPSIDGNFHDTIAIELLGYPKLCVMSPSFVYKNIGSDCIAEVPNLDKLFYEVLSQHGFTTAKEEAEQSAADTAIFDITKLVDISKLTQQADPNEYQGCHPIHDSTTEKNFSVNIKYNTWFCFRHNSGGGALQYFAMQQGLITCEQAKKGALRGKKFKETVKLAIQQGLIKKDDMPLIPDENQAERLLKLFLTQTHELFVDQHNEPFVRLKMAISPLRNCAINDISATFNPPTNTSLNIEKNVKALTTSKTPQIPQLRNIILELDSKQFKNYLSYLMYQAEQKAVGGDSLNSVINVLSGKAQQEGKKYHLYNRIAPASDGIWLDMCDDLWRAIKITAKGWEIVTEPPILFKRYSHQQPIVEPLQDEAGNPWKMLDYANIKKTDTNSRLMLLVSHISYLIPLIAHPNIVASGPQGCCKSYLFRLIRRIIDPSSVELLRIPKTEEDLALQLDHHWIAPYDNITFLPGWASDMICTAITGGGIAKRKLYTSTGDVILQFKRCVMLNGINIAAQKGDLLDRAMLFTLEAMSTDKRRTETEILADFARDEAVILTGFLNTMSLALRLYPTIELKEKQRLSDFDVYGCAIAIALGSTQEEFTKAYAEKVKKQNEEALNADPVALTILKFAQTQIKGTGKGVDGEAQDFWKGTPTELFNDLTTLSESSGIAPRNSKGWPKNPNALTRRINQTIPALMAVGIKIESYEGNPRKISIDAKKLVTEAKAKSIKEKVEKMYQYIKEGCKAQGTMKIENIDDKEILRVLLNDGKVYEVRPGELNVT
jgi:hypothetical protein